MINEESKTILNNEFDVSLEYKGEQSMDRGSSVPHKQWGTIPEGLGARVNCDRKPGIREKGETEKGYRECCGMVDICLPGLSKIKKLYVQNECISSVNYTC